MNAYEIAYLMEKSAAIEDEMAELYLDFGNGLANDPRSRQFFVLLSYEERTHANMLRLAMEHIQPGLKIPESEMPPILKGGGAKLEGFHDKIRLYRDTVKHAGVELFWALEAARELEAGEVNDALHWFTDLEVEPDVRGIMDELMQGADHHSERVAKYAKQVGCNKKVETVGVAT